MTEKENREILKEYYFMIEAAWEKDPALARNLEGLRDSYVELAKKCGFNCD